MGVRRVLPPLFLFLCIAVTALGFHNVFGDARAVDALGAAVACSGQGPKCQARPVSFARTPFFHEMVFQAAGKRVTVRCSRSFVFLGDYSCGPR